MFCQNDLNFNFFSSYHRAEKFLQAHVGAIGAHVNVGEEFPQAQEGAIDRVL